jgi:hypothetical protein
MTRVPLSRQEVKGLKAQQRAGLSTGGFFDDFAGGRGGLGVRAHGLCSCHVAVQLPCGCAAAMWLCSCHVAVQLSCGCAAAMWLCSCHVAVQLPCGCAAAMWLCSCLDYVDSTLAASADFGQIMCSLSTAVAAGAQVGHLGAVPGGGLDGTHGPHMLRVETEKRGTPHVHKSPIPQTLTHQFPLPKPPDEVTDLVDTSRGEGLSDLFNRHKLSQKFGGDLAAAGGKRSLGSGDTDLPRRVDLAERRRQHDSKAAKRAAAGMDDAPGGCPGLCGACVQCAA